MHGLPNISLAIHKQIFVQDRKPHSYPLGQESPNGRVQVLGREIRDLRQILLAQEVSNASSAASSLEQQVKNVSDTLLAHQLYELIAEQIQREKVAEVQAEFAFEVLQPPVAPDHHALPYNARNGLIVGALTFFLACRAILVLELRSAARSRKRNADQAQHDDVAKR